MLNKTYYDNLNVAKNASSEVIRAAYKVIIQNCEADLSPNANASRFLKTINDSFAVLSNPVQRAEYDLWLIEQESLPAEKKKLNSEFTFKHKTTQPDKNIATESASTSNHITNTNNANHSDKKQSKFLPWFVYAGVVLAIFLALKWFGIFGGESEIKTEQSAQNLDSSAQSSVSIQPALAQNTKNNATQNIQDSAIVVADSIPSHDQVSISEFIGAWIGNNGSPADQQTLKISLKTKQSIVFNLDAKAGQSIGGVYGIAAFTNSYANFYNKEYNCNILFTIKSGVLYLKTTNCQAYRETGTTFDGTYKKQALAKTVLKAVPRIVKDTNTKSNSEPMSPIQAVTVQPIAFVNGPKLRKFTASVKDLAGNINTIELLAKDKDAAKAIIRDFRGNPEIVKIKEVRK